MLYLSHTRAGVRAVGAFLGRFRGFGRVLSVKRSFYGWSAGVRGVLRARSCVFPVRAGAGVCPPHFSRAPNPCGFTLS